jgi:hypothetical protein
LRAVIPIITGQLLHQYTFLDAVEITRLQMIEVDSGSEILRIPTYAVKSSRGHPFVQSGDLLP